jgi:hypothetical protein
MPKNYVRTAESGNKCAHAFCSESGTPIYVTPSEPNPLGYRLALGAIDQSAQFGPPSRQIWSGSVLPLSIDLRAVEKSDRDVADCWGVCKSP